MHKTAWHLLVLKSAEEREKRAVADVDSSPAADLRSAVVAPGSGKHVVYWNAGSAARRREVPHTASLDSGSASDRAPEGNDGGRTTLLADLDGLARTAGPPRRDHRSVQPIGGVQRLYGTDKSFRRVAMYAEIRPETDREDDWLS